jgi:hypothetical protein
MRRSSTLSLFAGLASLLIFSLLVAGAALPPANGAAAKPGESFSYFALASGQDSDSDFGVKAQETIQKTFALPAAHRSVDIDNVWGSIEVVGGSGDQVQVTIDKTIRARSDEDLQRARKEVTLDVTQNAGDLKLYVNGPFRCNCDDCRGSHDERDYVVQMDFKVRVPEQTDLEVRTVNDGRVRISNVTGAFLVRNVNGGIEMDSMAGSGSVRTVNGPVNVSFRENPRSNSEFRTINGNVELRFQSNLAAAFRMKTFNGGIYTDFPVTALPLRPVSEERHGGKLILRADRSTGVQIGLGGPEIQIENLNGDIRILENHE